MQRWILLIMLALVCAPAAAADGECADCPDRGQSDDHASDQGQANRHDHSDNDAEAPSEPEETRTEPAEESASSEESPEAGASSTPEAGSSGAQTSPDGPRCYLYHWTGRPPSVSVNPVLGVIFLTPMDCVRELIDIESS